MKQLFTSLFLSVLLVFSSPAVAASHSAKPKKEVYVAVICSHDLIRHWTLFPRFKYTCLVDMYSFDALPQVLDILMNRAGKTPVFLDLMVHGDESGLQVGPSETRRDTVSMGWVISEIQEHCAGKHVLITFESCYSGRAYKCTIHGVKDKDPRMSRGYPGVPPFAIYGTGDSHSVIGQPMYLQFIHNERKWWVDLRDYDPLGKNLPLHPKEGRTRLFPYGKGTIEPTTLDIYNYVESYRNQN